MSQFFIFRIQDRVKYLVLFYDSGRVLWLTPNLYFSDGKGDTLTMEKNTMIEGLILIAIVSVAIVIALFGTTIMSGITSLVATMSAMVTGIMTGGATLLTSWWYWATANYAFTNYVGLFWLIFWGALFAYAGYEIATSDKGWRNAVGKRSNYVGAILLLFLLFQPLVVSYGASYLADTTAYSEVIYNVSDETELGDGYHTNYWYLKNATSAYLETQTTIKDNDTSAIAMVSTAHDDLSSIGTPTQCELRFRFNSTFTNSHTITKFVLSWHYVGAGNLTAVQIEKSSPTVSWLADETIITSDNASVTITPEPFQSQQFKNIVRIGVYFRFQDMSNIASAGDYMEMTLKFYETSTILTQETIMFYLAIAMGAVNFFGLMIATGIYKRFM